MPKSLCSSEISRHLGKNLCHSSSLSVDLVELGDRARPPFLPRARRVRHELHSRRTVPDHPCPRRRSLVGQAQAGGRPGTLVNDAAGACPPEDADSTGTWILPASP